MPAVKVYTLLKILHLTGAKDRCTRLILRASAKNIRYKPVNRSTYLGVGYESGETYAELCFEKGESPLTLKLIKPGFHPLVVSKTFNQVLEGIKKMDTEIADRIERR